ncbi:MAG: 16S rRNA (guanine(527)-N(7))-methyltransferase RsmG [Myxococcota bacterium]
MSATPVQTAIARGAEALGVPLGPDAPERLAQLIDALLHWNRRINLVAPTTALEAVERHVLDSLAVLRLLDRPEVQALGSAWWDIGSGSGFPALPLAIARPDLELRLVEPNGKKVAWLQDARARFGLAGVTVQQARLDALSGTGPAAAMSRATFAPEQWAQLAEPLVGPEGRILVMMGHGAPDEVTSRAWRLDRFELPESGATRVNAILRASLDPAVPS